MAYHIKAHLSHRHIARRVLFAALLISNATKVKARAIFDVVPDTTYSDIPARRSGVLQPLSRHTGSAFRHHASCLVVRTLNIACSAVRGNPSRDSERRQGASFDRGMSKMVKGIPSVIYLECSWRSGTGTDYCSDP